jgi:ribosomal protein S18 acetylase RimI-like enzyme
VAAPCSQWIARSPGRNLHRGRPFTKALAVMISVVPVTIRVGEPMQHRALVGIDQYAQAHPSRSEAIRDALKCGECFVAEVESEAVGYAILNYTFYGFGFIPIIVVAPHRRRLGIASALIREVRVQCRSSKLFTSANASNEAAQSLFRTVGFRRSGTIENLDPGDPEFVYIAEQET